MAIEKLKSTKSTLGAVLAFTCVILLNLSQVSAEGQRCYVCGPRSYQWYSNGSPPNCNDFKPEPQFEIECGKGYDYCAVIKTPGSQEISRVCIETHEPRGCITKACAKTKTLFTVCSCNDTLCNGEPTATTPAPDSPTPTQGTTVAEKHDDQQTHVTEKVEAETTTAKESTENKSNENNSNESNAKSEEKDENKTDTSKEEVKKEETHTESSVTEKPIKHESENTILSDETHINKTKESKQERDVPMNAVKPETVTSHSLPHPEALGQEHKKNVARHQGAPVDDEEDATEGSGSRIEDNKSQVPTTHLSQMQTTTTEKPQNSGAQTHCLALVSLWTIVALKIVF